MTDDRITYWPSSGSVGFDVNGMSVLISHGRERSSQHDKEQLAMEVLDRGSALAEKERVLVELEKRISFLERQNMELQLKLPPASPLRLFGAGIIRVDEHGFPWIMNKLEAESGWGTVGIRFDDWDDLFRHLNVRIVSAHMDAHGVFFRFEAPSEKAPKCGR